MTTSSTASQDQVVIFDTTLRDGEQSPGFSMNLEEKLRMAEALHELGADVLEAGFAIASPGDFDSVQSIAKRFSKDGPVVASLSRANTADIMASAEATKLAARPRIHIVLATSDLHMHLLAHDYFSGSKDAPFGLARVASHIARCRAEVENCLLVDNGDLLQGNLLGDHLAGKGARDPHPAIACLNSLGYDAATLGNHDFSFGLRSLSRALAGARYPIVLANAAPQAIGAPAPTMEFSPKNPHSGALK